EFILSEDYNKMTAVKSYQVIYFLDSKTLMYDINHLIHPLPAHQSRVMMVLFVLEMEWLLSIGQDKYFTWHCSESGQLTWHLRISAGCGLQYPFQE
ncbi:putative WD repeat and FYVE domain-containing protein, partial [Naja naja]